MKNVTFISHTETLRETLMEILPKYESLLSLVPEELQEQLGSVDRKFCQNSFISLNEVTYNADIEEPPKTLEGLLEDAIIYLLTKAKKINFIQCVGQEFKDFKLLMKNFNFGRTIMETNSTFKTLFTIIPYKIMFKMLINYVIIVPYKGQYVQVAGRPLHQKYNMKAVGSIARKSQAESHSFDEKEGNGSKQKNVASQKPSSFPIRMHRSYSYSTDHLHRMQIFYCSAMNRAPGLFARNIFFDKGQKISSFINEIGLLIKSCIDEHFRKKMPMPEEKVAVLTPIITVFFENVRDLFNLTVKNGSKTSKFGQLIATHCPLSKDYTSFKQRANHFIQHKEEDRLQDGKKLFDDIYGAASSYKEVINLMKDCIKRSIPKELIGPKNKLILMEMMSDFVSMKRFENFKMEDFLWKMDVFELEWVNIKYNKKFHRKIITKRRKYLALIISLIINEFVVPLIKLNFYVTEKHKEANRIFYYRKPLWTLISKIALQKFSQDNLEILSEQAVQKLKKQHRNDAYPEGKLRILPKKGTFRPIITFNRKVQFLSETNPGQKLKATLNQILSDTQLVLRNLKNVLGEELGYCIFDNRQIMKRYDEFIRHWRKMDCPPLKYFTLDIKKCYDSIDTSLLLKMIEETKLIEDLHLIFKYNRLYRNKKPLIGKGHFTSYFNYKERVTAVGLGQDPMEIRQSNKIPSINIFPCKQKLITKEAIVKNLKKICEGSMVSYRKNYWLQKLGIPQGLNVSGVLCSLYFSYLQDKYVNVKTGLLMRLTDDYLYIGPENEAVQVLDSLLLCANKSGFKFSQDKISKNFDHPVLKTKNAGNQIIWIGKLINVDNLEMFPNFQMNQKVSYAMNVNLTRKNLRGYLKNKLKSLLTNHFSSYFKPKLFPFQNLAKVVRLYTEISLQKFAPFIAKVIKSIASPLNLLIKVLKGAIHEFLLFACMLAEAENDITFYRKLYVQVVDELTAFCGRRQCNDAVYTNLKKIFREDCSRMSSKLDKQKEMEVEK